MAVHDRCPRDAIKQSANDLAYRNPGACLDRPAGIHDGQSIQAFQIPISAGINTSIINNVIASIAIGVAWVG